MDNVSGIFLIQHRKVNKDYVPIFRGIKLFFRLLHFHKHYLVLGFAAEGENVLRLAIRNLVDAEPLISGADQTRQVLLNILNVYRKEYTLVSKPLKAER